MQAIGYIRSARRNVAACNQQRGKIEAYCQEKGCALHALSGDNGRSGKKLDRPGLQAALSAVKPGSVLLVTGADRLARSVNDVGVVKARMRKAGARLTETVEKGRAPAGRSQHQSSLTEGK